MERRSFLAAVAALFAWPTLPDKEASARTINPWTASPIHRLDYIYCTERKWPVGAICEFTNPNPAGKHRGYFPVPVTIKDLKIGDDFILFRCEPKYAVLSKPERNPENTDEWSLDVLYAFTNHLTSVSKVIRERIWYNESAKSLR